LPEPPQASVPAVEEPLEQELYVYVTGAVRKPGLYAFKEKVRVAEAVHAAGDPVAYADVAAVNYADTIYDGMHVHLPYNLDGVPVAADNGLININEADEKKLGELPGVGPSTAKAIMDYRSTNGSFETAEDLQKVKGIGPAKWNKLKDKVTV
jgi:competence protein ComEA